MHRYQATEAFGSSFYRLGIKGKICSSSPRPHSQLSIFNPQLSAAVFTTNTLITEADFSYEGQDFLVSNTTVTINGPHSFNSLLPTSNAVLTHSPCTTTNTHKLDLTVANAVVV